MFDLNLVDIPSLQRIDGEVRHYVTPEGNHYPSVTTVLSAMADKTVLDVWRARVGDEEAYRVTNRSSRRGTAVHEMLEKYVLNQNIDFKKEMPLNKMMFRQIQSLLDNNVKTIYSSEGTLYSDTLKVAGSVDLVSDWCGVPAIVDFKTSAKAKQRDWIRDYFCQVALYSFMWWERTGMLHNKIVILIACEEEREAQVFEGWATEWLQDVKSLCKTYHERNV